MKIKGAIKKERLVRLVAAIILPLFFLFVGATNLRWVLQDPDFVSDYIFTAAITFLLLSYINWLNQFLNRRYAFRPPFTKHILLRLTGGVLVPAVFIWLLTYGYRAFVLRMPNLQMAEFDTNEFPLGVLVLVFFNLIYIGYYFYTESGQKSGELAALQQQLFTLTNIQPAQATHTSVHIPDSAASGKDGEDKSAARVLIAFAGNKNIPLFIENIAYIYKQGPSVQLKTFEDEVFLLNQSLEEVMQLLDEEHFFRANRQFIINIRSCRFFTNEDNGKLALHLVPHYDEDEVIISQRRATAFREWLNQ